MNSPRKLERLLAQALQKETEAQRMTDPIIEAAALAIESYYDNLPPSAKAFSSTEEALQVIVNAVTPLIQADALKEAPDDAWKARIRNAALERAAQVAEEYDGRGIEEIAARIRALKEQP